MKMIQDLLTECGYSEQQMFSFTYHGEKLTWEHNVMPFVSNAGSREGYLLVSVVGRELPDLLKSDFLSEITCELGHQEFYSPDMDRNITSFTNALEPILIVMIAGAVGFVAIAILMAVFQVSSSLG